MIAHEMRIAITAAWLIASAILLSMLISSHFLSESALLSASAALQLSHHEQGQCFFCGMTRAFIAISHGNLTQGIALNRWSVALYGTILANGALAAVFVSSLILKLFLSHRAVSHVDYNKSTQKEVSSCRY